MIGIAASLIIVGILALIFLADGGQELTGAPEPAEGAEPAAAGN